MERMPETEKRRKRNMSMFLGGSKFSFSVEETNLDHRSEQSQREWRSGPSRQGEIPPKKACRGRTDVLEPS
jgi:hypothetical protein